MGLEVEEEEAGDGWSAVEEACVVVFISALKCLDGLDTTDDGNGCEGELKRR